MTLEVVYGEPRHRAQAVQLAELLKGVAQNGTVYLGYPVLATADERVYVDALLVSDETGLVAFQIADAIPESDFEWAQCVDEQDRLYTVLDGNLRRHESLRRGRDLAVPIRTITVFPSTVSAPPEAADRGGIYCGLDEVPVVVADFDELDPVLTYALQAALQRVTTIKPLKRRSGVARGDSRGAVLKEIEKGIANLDRWQKQAAIETPEGPQRIRGLAGSGKTVVLALKAAYLHTQHPDWQVVLTFQSRSLYPQFADLVTRFTFEHSNDRPDFAHLQLLHAWGASGREGVYKTIARAVGAPFRNWNYALSTYGRENHDAFAGVCRELLELTSQTTVAPLFDAVLIDEAQDLPPEFFQLVYRFTRNPKRVVWAYDELQNLSESAMPATDELFGTTPEGDSLITLSHTEGEARTDIILPVCYRNSPWALATAHALGFGIYREGGLVQHFDGVDLWEQIGYRVVTGRLQPGRRVELERSPASYPDYFPKLLDRADAVVLRSFDTELEQDAWISSEIKRNLDEDELDMDDILIVLPDAYTSKRRASRLIGTLARGGIEAHLVGVGSSVDEMFVAGSVAIAHIHRAKGNEAPMVYVLDAQYGARTTNAVSRRNTLFTAITRSRAWVRICGFGDLMTEIAREVDEVRANEFRLAFTLPNAKKLAEMRRIHRERSNEEVETLRRTTQTLDELMQAWERDEFDLQDLPPRLRTRLVNLIRSDLVDDDDD